MEMVKNMREETLKNVDILIAMWKKGLLGGEIMPEDANPHFDEASLENYLYFTFPMALIKKGNHKTGVEVTQIEF